MRLATRLVLLGLVQLVLLAGAAVAIWFAEGPHDEAHPDEHLDPTMIHRLETVVAQPDALGAALDDLLRDRVEVSIYSDKRQLLASNVDPPLAVPEYRRHPPGERGDRPPPPPDGLHDPPPPFPDGTRRGIVPLTVGPHVMVVPMDVGGTRGILVARGVHRSPSALGPILTFLCGLLVLVIGALVTARFIVRPIEQLSRTAKALGAGDLRARSRLSRPDEIGVLGERFDEMADQITGLIASEKELLANVAHELRTPLARIGVALDLANEGDVEVARASLAEIAIDVSELATIVDDILIAMRFEGDGASKLPLRRAETQPSALATTAVERARGRHPKRPFELAAGSDLPAIDVDPMLFRRVIDNLLDNAHKYTPDGDSPISLTVARDGGRVAFAVRDRGVGIPAEDLPRVFTAFFRGDRSRSRETGGVGLGLTLAKRLVEAHGGTIDIASEVGAGTTVRVAVPAV